MLRWLLASLLLAADCFVRADAMSPQRQSSMFREAIPSLNDYGIAEGRWLSLLPADPAQLPQIYDGQARRFVTVAPPGNAAGAASVTQLRAVQYGVAAAEVVHQGQRLWGLVNTQGEWPVAPRYARIDPYINGFTFAQPANHEPLHLLNETGEVVAQLSPDARCRLNRLAQHALLTCTDKNVLLRRQTKHPSAQGSGEPLLLAAGYDESDPSGTLLTFRQDDAQTTTGVFQIGHTSVARGVVSLSTEFKGQVSFKPIAPNLYYQVHSYAAEVTHSLIRIESTGAGEGQAPAFKKVALDVPELKSATSLTEHYFSVCLSSAPSYEDRCGVMNTQGEWVLEPIYSSIWGYLDAVVFVQDNQECRMPLNALPQHCQAYRQAQQQASPALKPKYVSQQCGYQDAAQPWQIEPQFLRCEPFMGRIARVEVPGAEGLIDLQGRWLTAAPTARSWVTQEWEALMHAPAARRLTRGVINQTGEWVLPAVFNEHNTRLTESALHYCSVTTQRTCRWLNFAGQEAEMMPPASMPTSSQAPQFEVIEEVLYPSAKNNRWGVTDVRGVWRVPPQYAAVQVLSAERVAVSLSEDETFPRWQLMDASGKRLASLALDEVLPFEQGVAWMRQGEYWGLMGMAGQWLIEPHFSSVNAFASDVTFAQRDKQWYWVHASGEFRALPEVKEVIPFASGQALTPASNGGYWGYLNRRGEWAITPRFAAADSFIGQHALVTTVWPIAWSPPAHELSADKVHSVSIWPAGKVAVVAVPAQQAMQTDAVLDAHPRQRKLNASRAGGVLVFGLMDDRGAWVIPDLNQSSGR